MVGDVFHSRPSSWSPVCAAFTMVELISVFIALTALKALSVGGLLVWRYQCAKRSAERDCKAFADSDSLKKEGDGRRASATGDSQASSTDLLAAMKVGLKIRSFETPSTKESKSNSDLLGRKVVSAKEA